MSPPVAPALGSSAPTGGPPDFEYLLAQQANDAIKGGKDPAAVSKRLGDVVTFLRSNPHVAQQASQAIASGKDPNGVALKAYQLSQAPKADVSDATDTSHPLPAPAGNAGDVAINAATLGLHPLLYGAGEGLKTLLETGNPAEAGQAFHTGRREVQQSIADAERTKPQESGFATAVGTVAPFAAEGPLEGLAVKMGLAGEGAPEVATLGGRVLQSAGRGAITGGAYNAVNSEGTPKNRVLETLMGALEGGALGGAAPIAGTVATKIGHAVKNAATPITNQASTAADEQIARAIQSDGGIEAVLNNSKKEYGITPVGSKPLLATSAGPEINNTVNRATSIPTKGGYDLATQINAKKAGEANAIKKALGDASGVTSTAIAPDASVAEDVTPSAYQATKTIDSRQDVSAHRLYGALDGKTIDDPEIVKMIGSNPDLSSAFESAVKIAKGQGHDIENPLNSITTQLMRTGVPAEKAAARAAELGETDSKAIPLPAINYLKQGVQDVIEQRLGSGKALTRESGRQLAAAAQQVIDRVDAQVPEFARARAVFANDAARKDAIAAGEASIAKPAEQVSDEISGLKTPDEGKPFAKPIASQNVPDYKTGAVSALNDKIDALSPESNISKLFNSPEDVSRMHAILGDEGMQSFNDALDYGKRVESTASRVAANPASQQDAVRAKFPAGSQPAIGGSVRYSFVRALRGLHASRQAAFENALGDAMAKRLVLDPTGDEGAQFFQRVRGILDNQSAAKVAARARIAAQRMRQTAGLSGVIGAKLGNATGQPNQ